MVLGRIKTRESVKDIKILDKAAVVSERMKTALVRSKDQAENLMDDGQISPSEYAEDKIRYAAEDVTDQVWHEVSGQTKKAIERGKEAHRERRNEKRIHKNEERVRRYEEELRLKKQRVQDNLSRIGGSDVTVAGMVGADCRGKIRRPHGQASGADETRPSNLRSVLNAPSSSLLALPGNRQ